MRIDRIRHVVAAGLLATLLPLPAAAQPDPNLLTGLTFNDGTRNLPIEPATANAAGFGGPGTYQVHMPPGVRRVTVTPTWTNSQITGVTASARDLTYGKDTTAPSTWGSSASGTGKELPLKRSNARQEWGPGTTQLTLRLSGSTAVNGARYRFLLTHNGAWKPLLMKASRMTPLAAVQSTKATES